MQKQTFFLRVDFLLYLVFYVITNNRKMSHYIKTFNFILSKNSVRVIKKLI